MMKQLNASALVVAALVLPVAAPADMPSYAIQSGEQTIHGTITSINGKYGLTVHVDRLGAQGVTLHRGTIIGPTGLQLMPGMQVTIAGHTERGTFDANEIDVPVEYLEAQNRAWDAQRIVPIVPNGPFQTPNGPSAEGGG